MLAKNIYFKSNINEFETIDKIKINIIEENIIKLRKKFLKAIFDVYPNEEAIFL
jgi:hypothetical protein